MASDDAGALTYWANVQAEAIRQAWRELPADAGDDQARILAVAQHLDLSPVIVERVLSWPEIIDPRAFDRCRLPADVPLTLDFGERIGTAHVERTEQGLTATARGTVELGYRSRTEPLTLRMRLGKDGRWHPEG